MRLGTAALGLLAAAAIGCNDDVRPPLGRESDALASATPKRGGVLRMATYTDIRSLDAAVAFDEVSNAIEQLLYAKLVEFAPSGQVEPDLAESWTVSEDGLRYVFRLRPGVRFHDGDEVLASDFKRSIERSLSPDTPCPASSFYERIKGYADYTGKKTKELEGVVVLGDHLLAIELSEPDATLLAVLALPVAAPVCRSAGRTFEREFSLKACGAGPYKLKSWEPGRSVTVERFAGYYRPELPYLDGIEWALSVPNFTQRFKFEAGEQDFIRDFSHADFMRYRASPAWKGRGDFEPSKAVHSFFMNTEMPPFDRVEIRRAVAAAVDREQIAKIRPGLVRPASRLIPPAVPGHDPSPGQRFDYAAALEHMRKGGYPYDPATGKGGYPEEIDYVTVGGSFEQEAAEVYQQQLARIGIRIRVKALAWSAYLAASARRGSAKLGTDGWAMDFPDPSDFFEPILSTKAITDEDSQNRAFWSNKEFDGLLDQARRELVWERRMELYRRAEAIVVDEAPWCISYNKQWFELWHPYVHGYVTHPALSEHVGAVWIDEGAKRRAIAARGAPPFSRAGTEAMLARFAAPPGRR